MRSQPKRVLGTRTFDAAEARTVWPMRDALHEEGKFSLQILFKVLIISEVSYIEHSASISLLVLQQAVFVDRQ